MLLNLSIHKLKELRDQNGWSQEVFAKMTGLSVRTIQRIEADGKASGESVLAIASVLNVSPNEIQANSNEIKVNWSRKMIVKNLVALCILSGNIIVLSYFGGLKLHPFEDAIPTLSFIILFLLGATIIAFGTDGLLRSALGLRYLFSDEIEGGNKAIYLTKMYQAQIKFIYAGGSLAFLLGLISYNYGIHLYGETTTDYHAFAVYLIIPLYAVGLAEIIFRPLSIKLSTCDIAY